MAPYETNSKGINCLAHNPQLDLVAAGGEDGVIEFWNHTSKSKVIEIPIKDNKAFGNWGSLEEIRAITFNPLDGMTVAFGN